MTWVGTVKGKVENIRVLNDLGSRLQFVGVLCGSEVTDSRRNGPTAPDVVRLCLTVTLYPVSRVRGIPKPLRWSGQGPGSGLEPLSSTWWSQEVVVPVSIYLWGSTPAHHRIVFFPSRDPTVCVYVQPPLSQSPITLMDTKSHYPLKRLRERLGWCFSVHGDIRTQVHFLLSIADPCWRKVRLLRETRNRFTRRYSDVTDGTSGWGTGYLVLYRGLWSFPQERPLTFRSTCVHGGKGVQTPIRTPSWICVYVRNVYSSVRRQHSQLTLLVTSGTT